MRQNSPAFVVVALIIVGGYFEPSQAQPKRTRYSQCDTEKQKEWKMSSPNSNTWDPFGKRIHGTQFGCTEAGCSLENEATFFGIHAEADGSFLFGSDWRDIAGDFLRMSIHRNTQVYNQFQDRDSIFKTYKSPPYYRRKTPFGAFIPQICDFRAFTYCESKTANGSTCKCHPLYSSSPRNKDYVCLGRAGVPCKYDDPTRLQDTEHEGLCGEGLECEKMEGSELANFKAGKIWQGYGYSPILVRFILDTATHICKCAEEHKEMNIMHGCS